MRGSHEADLPVATNPAEPRERVPVDVEGPSIGGCCKRHEVMAVLHFGIQVGFLGERREKAFLCVLIHARNEPGDLCVRHSVGTQVPQHEYLVRTMFAGPTQLAGPPASKNPLPPAPILL